MIKLKVYIFCDSFANSGSRSSLVIPLYILIGDLDFSLTMGEDMMVDRERVSQAGWIAEDSRRSVGISAKRCSEKLGPLKCEDLVILDVILPPAL